MSEVARYSRRLVLGAGMAMAATVTLGGGLGCAAFAADAVKLGVSIPAATHGFTGGIVWWANQAKAELSPAM